jgi:hypothetical protein
LISTSVTSEPGIDAIDPRDIASLPTCQLLNDYREVHITGRDRPLHTFSICLPLNWSETDVRPLLHATYLSLASHIALEDAGAEYELRRIDFSKNEQQSPEYLRVNPKARVPALATPHGILTETPAILTFIAQTFPQAALAPLPD